MRELGIVLHGLKTNAIVRAPIPANDGVVFSGAVIAHGQTPEQLARIKSWDEWCRKKTDEVRA